VAKPFSPCSEELNESEGVGEDVLVSEGETVNDGLFVAPPPIRPGTVIEAGRDFVGDMDGLRVPGRKGVSECTVLNVSGGDRLLFEDELRVGVGDIEPSRELETIEDFVVESVGERVTSDSVGEIMGVAVGDGDGVRLLSETVKTWLPELEAAEVEDGIGAEADGDIEARGVKVPAPIPSAFPFEDTVGEWEGVRVPII